MKKLIVLSALVLSGLTYQSANAQIRFHVGINLAPRPVYVEQAAPVYNNDAPYYYLPDVGAYYSVNEGCYYYQDGDNWISAAYLPGSYRNYDWVHARRFAVNEPRPYLHNDVYRARYGGFEGRRDWGYHNDYSQRTYADRGRFENNPYRGGEDHRGFEQRGNYGQFGGRNDHQQYDNRGGFQNQGGRGGFENRGDQNRGNYGGRQPQGNHGERGGDQNRGNYGGGQPQGNRGGNQERGNSQPQGNHGNYGGGQDRGHDNSGQGMRGRF